MSAASGELGFPPLDGGMGSMADAYLAAGWSLIPIRPREKQPLVEWAEFQERRADVDEVLGWLARWPEMNLAVVTGRVSGVAVVDVDERHGGLASAAALEPPLPKTLTQRTPHGYHLFFRHAEGVRSGVAVRAGLDVRGEGGYVVVAPSVLADGAYRWHRRLPLAEFPTWLLEKPGRSNGRGAEGAGEDHPRWVTELLRHGAEAGTRNREATRLAGYFTARGLPADVILEVLEPFRAACRPPMDARELQRTVRSVQRYYQQARGAGIEDPPTREVTRLGARYTWEASGVAVEVEGLAASSQGLHAELVFTTSLPGYPRRLHGPVRVNLLSGSTRSQLVKALEPRLPMPWEPLVDELCRLAVEDYRAGEPPVVLSEAVAPTGGQHALEPLILADGPTIWFADGGAGKSLMALAAAISLTGTAALLPGASREWRVLYLDWEWDAWQHRERMRQLLGERAADCPLLYRKCTAPLTEQVGPLQRLIEEHGVDFVVIDSVGAACGDEPESARVAIAFANAVRALGVGSLWLAHVNRVGDKTKPFGSSFWHNSARATWYIEKQQDGGANRLCLGFYNRKSNSGKLERARGFSVEIGAERIVIQAMELQDVPELARRLPQREQILAALARGRRSLDELVEELDIQRSTLKVRLSELKREGRVVDLGNAEWGLAARDEAGSAALPGW